MRKQTMRSVLSKLRATLVATLIAAICLFALPFGLFGGRVPSVKAEEREKASEPKAQARAGNSVEVTINYLRKNGNYEGWNIWLWLDGEEGAQKDFTKFDVTTPRTGDQKWASFTGTFTIPAVDEPIGFIIRKGEWEAKDPDGDRHIPASMIKDGKVTIWCLSGESEFTDNEEEIGMPLITNAEFRAMNVIYIGVNKTITENSVFKVREAGTTDALLTIPVKDADPKIAGRSRFEYKIPEASGFVLDFSKKYEVYDDPLEGAEADTTFPKPKAINLAPLYGSTDFDKLYGYKGALGAQYTAQKTTFTLWAPFASAVKLNIYDSGDVTETTKTEYDMAKVEGDKYKGQWEVVVNGDLSGKYYTYSVTNGTTTKEVVDPYAYSAGQNGKRGMIVDFASDKATPEGWATQKDPQLKSASEAVIYEAHLRDLTISPTSGVSEANRGKFLGLTETGTTVNGEAGRGATALDYIKALGVTEVHFQPLFDFASVNEYTGNASYQESFDPSKNDGQFNWGYDPLNYNVPEGSYSSDPTDGYKRVKEMRAMIAALHNAGVQVVMDVVYNHVSSAAGSNFEAIMPGYYFRTDGNGDFTNGSGCGNETASEHAMFRKFMVDSVLHWATQYKVDGFRFDLMALHDVDTMNLIAEELKKVNPDVLLYGEGWTGGTSGMSGVTPASLSNAELTPDIAYFDDITRDGLKGSVFNADGKGFIQGANFDAAIYVGAVGATDNANAGYDAFDDKKNYFAKNPTQNINYVSAHDNSTLWDKLNASTINTPDELKAMNRMAATAVLTSQGASFFLAGEEMLRTKKAVGLTEKDGNKVSPYDGRPVAWMTNPEYYFSDNSYKSPDATNAIDWTLTETNKAMVDFYRELIAIKKTFPQFHITTATDIKKCVTIADANKRSGVASYAVKAPGTDEYVVVLFNNQDKAKKVSVPKGSYTVHVNGDKAKAASPLSTFKGSTFTVGARSAVVMKGKLTDDAITAWKETASEKDDSNLGLALGLGIGIPAAVLIAGGAVFGVMYGKKKKGKNSEQGAGDKTDDDPENDPEPVKEQEEAQPEEAQEEHTEE